MLKLKANIISLVLVLFSVLSAQNRIAIVLPNELKEYDNSAYSDLLNDVTAFELFLLQSKVKYSVLFSDELNQPLTQKFDALIFPTSSNLSEENYYLLESALNNGMGVISFGNMNYFKDGEPVDLCKKLYGVESQQIVPSDNHNFIQNFSFNSNLLKHQSNFQILIKAYSLKNLYKVNNREIFSFGCFDNQNELTSSFYGFRSSGRFAHFGFTFSKIISDKNSLEKFQNLLLYLFNFIRKESGLWLTNSENATKHFLYLVDLTKSSFINESTLSKFSDQKFPLVLASNIPEKLKTFYHEFGDKLLLALKVDCNQDIDTLIKKINSEKTKLDFVILENNCLDERDIKRLSFTGIETILIKNGKEFFFNSIYNVVVFPYSSISLVKCSANKIIVAEYPDKINCDKLLPENTLKKVSELKSVIKSFNREELINEFLINELKLNTFERSNELLIEIHNPYEFEIRNFDLIIDSKKLFDDIIYDFRINGKSRFVKKDLLTNYYKIHFDSIAPKANITINIFFDDNI